MCIFTKPIHWKDGLLREDDHIFNSSLKHPQGYSNPSSSLVVEFPPTSRIPHTRIMTKLYFQLTMHMFSDSHTFLIAIFGHIQNSINHFATFPFLFHVLQEEGVVGSFLYILAVPARLIQSTCVHFKLVLHFDKRVYKAKSSEILGCGRLQLGREGIRALPSVVSCNSLPLSCGSVLILVAAYRALL